METSFPWPGKELGSIGPYDQSDWKEVFNQYYIGSQYSSKYGIFNGATIRSSTSYLALTATVSAPNVTIATGLALVDGTIYSLPNGETVVINIPTPSTNPRIDRIVLQKDNIFRTVRIVRLIGVEDASPIPLNLTQTNLIWELPLYQIHITTGGTITLRDERSNINSNLLNHYLSPGAVETVNVLPGWYFDLINAASAPTVLKMYLFPLYISSRQNFDAMQTDVRTAAAGKNMRMAIYQGRFLDKGLFPGPLIFQSSDKSIGSIFVVTATLSSLLLGKPGWYFIAGMHDDNTNVIRFSAADLTIPYKTPVTGGIVAATGINMNGAGYISNTQASLIFPDYIQESDIDFTVGFIDPTHTFVRLRVAA